MAKSRPKLLILDANALLHRAWHAIPPLTAPDGTIVNAAYGMASVAIKVRNEEKPDLFIACWDTAAATFRHVAYEAYKAHREEKEQELYDQVPIAKEVLEAIGIKSLAIDGFEADDLIGTLSVRGVEAGYDVRIVTGDRDTLQLVGDHVKVIAFKKGVSETKIYDEAAIKEEYGVTPEQMIDWKAMKGDPSDNIPGIKGIGEKSATELIQTYGSLEGVISAAHDSASPLKEGLRKKIIEGEDDGREALALVRVMTNVPIKESFADLAGAPDRERFIALAGKYGFRSLIVRFDGKGTERAEKAKGKKAEGVEQRAENQRKTAASAARVRTAVQTRKSGTVDEAFSALEQLTGDPIVLNIVRETQETLFGGAETLLVVADNASCAVIPFSLLKEAALHDRVVSLIREHRIVCHDAKAILRELDSVFSPTRSAPLAFVADHDTLIAAYLLSAGERTYDLEALSLQELGKELPKEAERACETGVIVRRIAERQRAKMNPEGMTAFMERFELPLTPVLRDMERAGIRVDLPYLKRLANELGAEKARLEIEMEKLVGHPFNPGSPSQLAVILFDELKLPSKGIKRGKNGYSTAASELDKLEGAHPIIEKIGEHREIAKLLSTYVETLPLLADADGRVHTTFNQAITSTGRLSSSDPNVQNIPIRTELGRKIRRAFIAGSGLAVEPSNGRAAESSDSRDRMTARPLDRDVELLSCDYSQIELRVVAALANDARMLEAFQSGTDIHTATAAAIWNIPPREVTKGQRRAAKAVNFGIIYGQGPQGLARSAGISLDEARSFIAKYFETYQGVREFLDQTKALARTRGYVETLFGRRRPIPEIVSGVQPVRAAAERMAINMPVQGTSADLLKLAMIEVAKGLPGICADARMLLQVHDELLFEVPSSDIVRVAAYVKDVMEHVEKIGCPIIVDAKHGKNWDEMEPVIF